MSIPVLLDKKPTVVPGGLAGERSGGARKISAHTSCQKRYAFLGTAEEDQSTVHCLR